MKMAAWAALAIGVASPALAALESPRAIDATDKANIQKAVNGSLNDPESARFRWLPATGKGQIYCGYVNAKNRFGGYIGFVPFAVFMFGSENGKRFAGPLGVGSAIGGSPDTLAILQTCADAGIDMTAATVE